MTQKKNFIKVKVSTNGMKLSQDIIVENLEGKKIIHIAVSRDGGIIIHNAAELFMKTNLIKEYEKYKGTISNDEFTIIKLNNK